ncbi:RNA polymerase ECF-type sigma factor [gut metagenome]|uniref:RNA polymerase ECF-type sigma factor n=1 Tax=gut metagenome TaxID=749906 RepID=J9D4A8_9ZZZZ
MKNEKDIVELCKTDIRKGFQSLMDHYQAPLYHYLRRLLVSHEDTQDALQETFIRVFKSLNTFRGDSALSTWLYRVATNEGLRILDERKRQACLSDEEQQEALFTQLMASEYIDYDDGVAVQFQAALLKLPQMQRTVFNLRYYEDMPYEEIAKILGGKADTMKVHYHIAKQKIKDYILNQ